MSTAHLPILILEDRSGDSLLRIHVPLHVPGFRAYCPICGIGCKSKKEAAACCAVLTPAHEHERRIKTGHERTRHAS